MSNDLKARSNSQVVEGLTKIVAGVLMLWGVRVIPVHPAGHFANDFMVVVLFVSAIWALAGGAWALVRRC
jgi:hypothetical protein